MQRDQSTKWQRDYDNARSRNMPHETAKLFADQGGVPAPDRNSTTPDLGSFQAHMDRCMKAVLAPMRRPDIKVTIIVRAPEALPHEAMISTNDDLAVVLDAVSNFAGNQR